MVTHSESMSVVGCQNDDMMINYAGSPLVVLLISWTSVTSLLLILTTTSAPAYPGYLISSNVVRLVAEKKTKTNHTFTFETRGSAKQT